MDDSVFQVRGERFGSLANALIRLPVMVRTVEYRKDLSLWMRFNRGPRQFTVRYDPSTAELIVWHGYCFLKLYRFERKDELEDVQATANWLATWRKEP